MWTCALYVEKFIKTDALYSLGDSQVRITEKCTSEIATSGLIVCTNKLNITIYRMLYSKSKYDINNLNH